MCMVRFIHLVGSAAERNGWPMGFLLRISGYSAA
jgi:hypothetical protein